MKHLITILSLMMCLNVFSQIAPPRKTINLNLPQPAYVPTIRTGPMMMIGGATFIAAGLLTPPTMVAGTTNQKQPAYKQMRMLPILTGAIVMTIGVGITIGGN